MRLTPESHDALRCVSAFDALTDAEVDAVLLYARERRLAGGEVLYREGDPGSTMAIVLVGELAVDRKGPRGSTVHLMKVLPGELVGELVCIDPAPRLATVSVTMPTTVFELDRTALESMSTHVPRVASHLVGMVIRRATHRLREIDEAIAAELGDRPVVAPAPAPPEPATEPSGWRKLVNRLTGVR